MSPPSTVQLDPTSLRGLAHPLRVRLLAALRADGPATATLLAARLGQSTGATSYHLRQLAQYGFVVDVPERATGRERWWRAAHERTSLESVVGQDAPAETEGYLRAIAALYAGRVDHWIADLPALPPEWVGTSTLSDWRLRLTPAEAAELRGRLVALVESYRQDAPTTDAPAGAEPVVVQAQLMAFATTTNAATTATAERSGGPAGGGEAAGHGESAGPR